MPYGGGVVGQTRSGHSVVTVGTLCEDDDDDEGSENIGKKKMNLRSFNFNRVYLVPLNKSNAVTFLKLPNKLFVSGLFVGQINNRSMPKIKIK